MEAACRPSDAARIGDGDEIAQMPKREQDRQILFISSEQKK